MILFAILLYLFFPEVFSLSSILKIIVILLIWDIFCAAIRVKNKSFNREVKRHIDKQYEKFFFELAHPNDEVIIDKDGAADANDLNVFEAEKISDFIRNEIKAKRYKGENT